MRITLRNKDIYVGVQQVMRFAARDVPFKISYACGRSLVRLREQFDLIESERQKIVKRHKLSAEGTSGLDTEQAALEELTALQNESVDIDVHSVTLSVWTEHMDKPTCKECKRGSVDVSSDEVAALIKLGILVADDA